MSSLRCASAPKVAVREAQRASRLSVCGATKARRTATIVCAATQDSSASRREVLGSAAAAALSLASLTSVLPAQAFLGFGDDNKLQEDYAKETSSILTDVRNTIGLAKGDPAKEDKVKNLRKEINTWVAKYRREPKVSGKPSYGNTYSVLNALAGHYNSFGTDAPIPKKRLERLVKELDDATLYLSRGR